MNLWFDWYYCLDIQPLHYSDKYCTILSDCSRLATSRQLTPIASPRLEVTWDQRDAAFTTFCRPVRSRQLLFHQDFACNLSCHLFHRNHCYSSVVTSSLRIPQSPARFPEGLSLFSQHFRKCPPPWDQLVWCAIHPPYGRRCLVGWPFLLDGLVMMDTDLFPALQ